MRSLERRCAVRVGAGCGACVFVAVNVGAGIVAKELVEKGMLAFRVGDVAQSATRAEVAYFILACLAWHECRADTRVA